MEGVIEANKLAVQNSHRVLNLISENKDHVQSMNLTQETEKAVSNFKRVISILNNGVGHARVRNAKIPQIPVPQSILLDSQVLKPYQLTSKNVHSLGDMEYSSMLSLSLGNSSLKLSSNETENSQLLATYCTLQLQQQYQDKVDEEVEMMYSKSNLDLSLTLNNPGCTPTMPPPRPLASSLSMDRSVANMDGNSSHLIGGSSSSDQSLQKLKRCSLLSANMAANCGTTGYSHHSYTSSTNRKIQSSINLPAISKFDDIIPTSDEYSWKKYGQKQIEGSPYRRAYYRCSSGKGCSARKHVEKCPEDPSMFIITYKGDHTHQKLPSRNA